MLLIWDLPEACGQGTRNRRITCSGLKGRICMVQRSVRKVHAVHYLETPPFLYLCSFLSPSSSVIFSMMVCCSILSRWKVEMISSWLIDLPFLLAMLPRCDDLYLLQATLYSYVPIPHNSRLEHIADCTIYLHNYISISIPKY